jgi:DNA-binding CsgD family transcriptional regulator
MISERDRMPAKPLPLSPREAEVLKWIACGKTYDEISQFLAVSSETVRSHLKGACRKLNATNKTHATAIALVFGMIRAAPSPKWGMALPMLFGLSKHTRARSDSAR